MSEPEDYIDMSQDLEVARGRAAELLRAAVDNDRKRCDELTSEYLNGPKLRLYLVALWWASWLLDASPAPNDEAMKVILYPERGHDGPVEAQPHHLLAAKIVRAVLDDEVDSFAGTFCAAPDQQSFDAALYLCAELKHRVDDADQASLN
ncbi:hypothetical protein [Caudovirales GX15bay]|nr:hypothetical protein [Caudovirales GX15bay]